MKITDNNDYRISTLSSTFGNHADIEDKQNEEMLLRYQEEYPDSPIPEHMIYPFNLFKALCVMACEIERIKHFVGIKENN